MNGSPLSVAIQRVLDDPTANIYLVDLDGESIDAATFAEAIEAAAPPEGPGDLTAVVTRILAKHDERTPQATAALVDWDDLQALRRALAARLDAAPGVEALAKAIRQTEMVREALHEDAWACAGCPCRADCVCDRAARDILAALAGGSRPAETT